jgi:uncharacterized protein YndB with AHSA1/START domain
MTKSAPPIFSITQSLAATPQAVFDAWVTPEIMKRWMFVMGDNDIYKAQVDLRVGGSYSILEWTGSEDIDHFGQYKEIRPPSRLAFGLRAPKHFPFRTAVTIDIEPHPDGAKLIFNQVGVPANIVEAPWRVMFDTLASVLGDPRSAAERNVRTTGQS